MGLIIIYGPPASGKLTIAKALAEKIGMNNQIKREPV
jgi:adenylate kinase family enzyme